MVEIDKTKVFLLIEPGNQATEEALNLDENKRFVPRDQAQQPITAGPSDTTSKPALHLTIDEFPKNEDNGYIFGSNSTRGNSTRNDVLMDSKTLNGVSARIFSIQGYQNYQRFTLKVLTNQAFYVGQRSELGEVSMEKVKLGRTRDLLPVETWVVAFGIAELVLKPVMRDEAEREEFIRNF